MRDAQGTEFSRFLPLATDEGESRTVGGLCVAHRDKFVDLVIAGPDRDSMQMIGMCALPSVTSDGVGQLVQSKHAYSNHNRKEYKWALPQAPVTRRETSLAKLLMSCATTGQRSLISNRQLLKWGVDWDEVTAEFGSMHGLILEMVSDLSAAIVQPLERQVTDRTVRDVLIEFGNRFANAYSVSHLVALYRIALTEATRHSDIAKRIFRART